MRFHLFKANKNDLPRRWYVQIADDKERDTTDAGTYGFNSKLRALKFIKEIKKDNK